MEDDSTGLTFQWRDRDRPLTRLFFYLVVTIVGAGCFFMLFKVVYPQARHFSTAPQQVLFLDPSQPATRDIVNRTADDNFLLLSPDSDPSRMEASSRGSFPVFKPGFSGFEMKLVDLPGVEDKRTLPRVFGIADMPLPPVATVMKAKESAGGPAGRNASVLRVVLLGELRTRELATSRDIRGITPSEAMLPRFRLCVNETGRVTFALPLDSVADAKLMRLLQRRLTSLRFRPADEAGVQWGDASFVWESGKR